MKVLSLLVGLVSLSAVADVRSTWDCKGADAYGDELTLVGQTAYIGEDYQQQVYILARGDQPLAFLSEVTYRSEKETSLAQSLSYGRFKFKILKTGSDDDGFLGTATGTFTPKRLRGHPNQLPASKYKLNCRMEFFG